MGNRKTIYIIQFDLANHNSEELFEFESSLHQGMEQNKTGAVDGNDIGEGTYSIYVFPNAGALERCLENIKMWLKVKKLLHVAIIAKVTPSGASSVIHPSNYKGRLTLTL